MDGSLITVKVLINRVLFKPILINIGNKCYSIVDKNLTIKLRLSHVKIPPKPIISFVKENTKERGVEITKIAEFCIDIQGYRRNIFVYVVPLLLNLIIMGLSWIREDNIIIKPVTNTLIINSYNLIISIKEILVLLEIKELTAAPFAILIKGVKKCQKPLIIFRVLLKDITKVLRLKIIRIPVEIRKLLLAQYHNYLPLFEGGMAAELPPYRLGINYIFILEEGENGQERNPP